MATAQVGTLLRHIQKLAAGRGARHGTDRQLLDDFAARRDESAFAALVSRHGAMVLRVCRRVLRHEQDAEDAFQATFLVLAGRAGSIRKRDTVADWLHGVAYRTAMNARRGAARRRNHEARLQARRTDFKSVPPTWDDVQAVLDEEVQRLPPRFREAFVLCVLEGKGGPEAAAALGCKEGTVKSRVSRARRLLQRQLDRRGIRLAALLAALAVAESAGRAALPVALARVTVGFGLLVAAGSPAAAVIPPHVAALAAGVTRAMWSSKLKVATAVLLAVGLVAAAGALARQALAAQEPPAGSPTSEVRGREPAPAEGAAKPPAADDKDSLAYGGRVLGPDGKPVAGAKLYLTRNGGALSRPTPAPESATTGSDGRFRFTAPKAKFGDQDTVVTAAAASYGAGWVQVPADGPRDDLTLQLADDDVPITGQVVDLEGKPVPNATLTVLQIRAAPEGDLGPWLEAAKEKGQSLQQGLSFQLEDQYLPRRTTALSPKATTDGEGRFRLTGIGRDRLVRVQLDGPAVVSQRFCVLTRPAKAVEVTELKGGPRYGHPRTVTTYYGADFRHVAAPARPITGVVRDKDTKKPLAGVTIQSYEWPQGRPVLPADIVQTTTDEQGRYRLTGMPKGTGIAIKVAPPGDLPYVAVRADVPDSHGLDPVTVDVELKRGAWVEGRLTDKVTGKPVPGEVQYLALKSNPNLRDYPDALPGEIATTEDGSYRVVGLPGPGLVAVRCQKDHYLRVTERDDEYGTREPYLATSPYELYYPIGYRALARIDPAKGADAVKRDITLDPGRTFTGTVLGPDGKPLTGVRSFNTNCEVKGAEFTVRASDPRRRREVLFQHPEKGLFGVAQPPEQNGGSVVVRMRPGVTVTGRLVDADGKPRAGVELEASSLLSGPDEDPHAQDFSYGRTKTDREGRFRLERVQPCVIFRLSDGKTDRICDGLYPDRATDLGDVRIDH
jgi:RNA polymerase sigma factor (sigma-70 family)